MVKQEYSSYKDLAKKLKTVLNPTSKDINPPNLEELLRSHLADPNVQAMMQPLGLNNVKNNILPQQDFNSKIADIATGTKIGGPFGKFDAQGNYQFTDTNENKTYNAQEMKDYQDRVQQAQKALGNGGENAPPPNNTQSHPYYGPADQGPESPFYNQIDAINRANPVTYNYVDPNTSSFPPINTSSSPLTNISSNEEYLPLDVAQGTLPEYLVNGMVALGNGGANTVNALGELGTKGANISNDIFNWIVGNKSEKDKYKYEEVKRNQYWKGTK